MKYKAEKTKKGKYNLRITSILQYPQTSVGKQNRIHTFWVEGPNEFNQKHTNKLNLIQTFC